MRRIQWSDLMVIVFSALFYNDLREQAAAITRAPCKRTRRATGGIEIRFGARRIGRGDHARFAAIGFFADLRVERQLAEQLHVVLLGHALAAASTEDVLDVAAVRTDVQAHVLDDAEHGHRDLLEHLETLARIGQGDVLRRGHNDRAGDRYTLSQGELNVPRTGR